jgi:hypothetical protein
MFILDLMFHPKGRVVEEVVLLFVDQDEETEGASFFEKFTTDDLPVQYRLEEFIVQVETFMEYFRSDFKEKELIKH